MSLAFAEIPAGSPTVHGLVVMIALILVVTGRELHLSRLRRTLNRALHEVRRPLQAVVFDSPGMSVLQAVRAVEQLDRALNGGREPTGVTDEFDCRTMLVSCVRRWRSRAVRAGVRLRFGWLGPDVRLCGDGVALCGAIENLILNAIEHGGRQVRVEADARRRHEITIRINDSGQDGIDGWGRRPQSRSDFRSGCGGSHGHGLKIARVAVERHGGRLETDFSPSGSTVTVILPRTSFTSTAVTADELTPVAG